MMFRPSQRVGLFLQRLPQTSVPQSNSRTLATSATKRKWKRQEKNGLGSSLPPATPPATPERDHSPFLYLVVFPLVMTSLVVALRPDFRNQLDQFGDYLIASFRNKPVTPAKQQEPGPPQPSQQS